MRAKAGKVDEAWVKRWEQVFDLAAKSGLGVIPVFGVWADWNDGSNNEAWHAWERNRYNAKVGGPARSPAELFDDTTCRKQWLTWLETLVKRWRPRKEIVAWEIFSELDLLTGSTEERAAGFVKCASSIIRRADGESRPITVSLAGINEWPKVFSLDAVDVIQIHPYANHPRFRGNLDDMIIATVRVRRQRYQKPVLIGECGLDSRPPRKTLTVSKRAAIGIRHAIWAAAVSGSMNGRMLWWEDGYGRYEGADIISQYHDAAGPVNRFVEGVDYTGFRPVAVVAPPELRGAALGNKETILCWYRDVHCNAPSWSLRPVSGARITVPVGPIEKTLKATFYDTSTGKTASERTLQPVTGKLVLPLPDFEGSIALKLSSVQGILHNAP